MVSRHVRGVIDRELNNNTGTFIMIC